VRNAPAVRLYERAGFETVDEVVAWTRARLWLADVAAEPDEHAYDAAAIAQLARTPAPCWQREPPSVAAAAPFGALFVGAPDAPDAYAFTRRGERMTVLDARAHDAASAAALLAALDARLGAHELALVNESSRGALHDAFTAHGEWREYARQHRMRLALR